MQGDKSNVIKIGARLRNEDGGDVSGDGGSTIDLGQTADLTNTGDGNAPTDGSGIKANDLVKLVGPVSNFLSSAWSKLTSGGGTSNYDKYKNQSGHADLFDATYLLVLADMQNNPTQDWANTFAKSLSDFKNDEPDCAAYYAMKYLSGQWPLANDGARRAGLPYHYADYVNSGGVTTFSKKKAPASSGGGGSTSPQGNNGATPPAAASKNTIYYILGAVVVILIVAIIIKKK